MITMSRTVPLAWHLFWGEARPAGVTQVTYMLLYTLPLPALIATFSVESATEMQKGQATMHFCTLRVVLPYLPVDRSTMEAAASQPAAHCSSEVHFTNQLKKVPIGSWRQTVWLNWTNVVEPVRSRRLHGVTTCGLLPLSAGEFYYCCSLVSF